MLGNCMNFLCDNNPLLHRPKLHCIILAWFDFLVCLIFRVAFGLQIRRPTMPTRPSPTIHKSYSAASWELSHWQTTTAVAMRACSNIDWWTLRTSQHGGSPMCCWLVSKSVEREHCWSSPVFIPMVRLGINIIQMIFKFLHTSRTFQMSCT